MPSSSRSRGSGRGPDGAPRSQVVAPMSERQQLALVMQISSQDAPPAAPTPAEERKRTRQQRNERGETPLHVAAIRGDHDEVKRILDQGQEPDVCDFAGWTALHEACSYGWYQVVVALVKSGANVNAKGLDDDTPLHDAATSGNLKMVKYLVEHGAEPYAKNAKGKIPADYAAPHIYDYLHSIKDNNSRSSHGGRARDDSVKKGNASANDKRSMGHMDSLAQGDFDGKEAAAQEKSSGDSKDDSSQLSSGVVSSSQDEPSSSTKRSYPDDNQENDAEDDVTKRKKRKDADEPMGKPAPVARSGPGRKPPGPASKAGAQATGKGGSSQGSGKGAGGKDSGKGSQQAQKGGGTKLGPQNTHQSKSSSTKGASSSASGKQDRKSPVASPKPSKDDGDDDQKCQESSAPKVPPLKIVIPGGASGSSSRTDQEGDSSTGQRGSGKGRGGASTLPYVIPCTSTDAGQTSDSSDGTSDDKRPGDTGKAGQRVLRSHRTNDGEKERTSPQTGPESRSAGGNSIYKSPLPSGSGQDDHHQPSTSGTTSGRFDSTSGAGASVELHPRKRKIKASKESHSRDSKNNDQPPDTSSLAHNVTHSNPYQMYIHIRKQIERRQKSLFPVKPKPPKDFNKYLMNRCTYTLQSTVNPEPQVEIPHNLPPQMHNEFMSQEKERSRLRVQHLVEKEKLVLAVEQEILRVHGRAERAVANQTLPFSVCTILRDKEVYNVLAPEQEEKQRNAQRSRCNGRQINSWLQEVDDKWEKIKEGMLRRQHTEAETLHAVQVMEWEWKLKEVGICDYKTTPKIDPTHGQDDHHQPSTSGTTSGRFDSKLHPRKRKIKASKESHSRDSKNNDQPPDTSSLAHNVTHSYPYQMYIHIRKQGQDDHHQPSTSGTTSGRFDSTSGAGASVELHPRKRKIKASKESHSRDSKNNDQPPDTSSLAHNVTHSYPYQMYIHIRKQGQDDHHQPSTSGTTSGRFDSTSGAGASVELHPRKRKIKASKESHSRDSKNNDQPPDTSSLAHNVTHSNPYQMYIHIRKQIERRQKSLFPVKPKPPKDFNEYLMKRRNYTLQSTVNPEPQVEIPHNLPPQMHNEFMSQEEERSRLRVQHLVEKEKLVLAVEQEILRVHGRAERAVANQTLPFSVCTILRDKEVYNLLAPEQEEKQRNAQRSQGNGLQINSWLQEVDDKWEKIKEGMLRRQHTEAETLHAVQVMEWEWKLKEVGICDYKTTPKIDPTHVPQIHVSNFDLPA